MSQQNSNRTDETADLEEAERRKKAIVINKQSLVDGFNELRQTGQLPEGIIDITVTEMPRTQSWQSPGNNIDEAITSAEGLFDTGGKTFQAEFTKADGSKTSATLDTITNSEGSVRLRIISNDPEAAVALAKASGCTTIAIPDRAPQEFKEKVRELCQKQGLSFQTLSEEQEEAFRSPGPSS